MEWIPGPPCKRLELDSLIQSSGYPRKWAWLGEGRAMCPNHTAYTQGQGCPPCHLPTPCHITSGLTPSSNASEQRLRENLGEMLRVSHDREASSDRMFCRLMKFSHFSLKKHSFFSAAGWNLIYFSFFKENEERQQTLKLEAEQFGGNLDLIPDLMGPSPLF